MGNPWGSLCARPIEIFTWMEEWGFWVQTGRLVSPNSSPWWYQDEWTRMVLVCLDWPQLCLNWVHLADFILFCFLASHLILVSHMVHFSVCLFDSSFSKYFQRRNWNLITGQTLLSSSGLVGSWLNVIYSHWGIHSMYRLSCTINLSNYMPVKRTGFYWIYVDISQLYKVRTFCRIISEFQSVNENQILLKYPQWVFF